MHPGSKVRRLCAAGGAFISFDGILYNKKDFAILMWGAAVKKTGITELNKAQSLWQEINERNLTEPELKALRRF